MVDELSRYKLAYEETMKVLLVRDQRLIEVTEMFYAARSLAIKLWRDLGTDSVYMPDFTLAAGCVDEEIQELIKSKRIMEETNEKENKKETQTIDHSGNGHPAQ